VLTGLLERCEGWPPVTSLLVGCSLGRGAGDALSDVDATLGVGAPPGPAGAPAVDTAEALAAAALPGLGHLIDVLRERTGPAEAPVRRTFPARWRPTSRPGSPNPEETAGEPGPARRQAAPALPPLPGIPVRGRVPAG
jgi:hypothetical protein